MSNRARVVPSTDALRASRGELKRDDLVGESAQRREAVVFESHELRNIRQRSVEAHLRNLAGAQIHAP